MKRNHFLLFATFLLLSVLAGCCFERKEIHYEIPPYAYSLIPYDTGSTFRMRDTAGTVTTFEYASASLEDWSRGTCARCCEEAFVQEFRFRMQGGSPPMELEFGLLQDGDGGQSVHDPTLFQLTFNNGAQFNWTRCFIDFGGECNTDPLVGVACLFNHEVAGVMYDTLYHFDRPLFVRDILNDNDVNAMWYSTDAGLVKYTTVSGNVWELVP